MADRKPSDTTIKLLDEINRFCRIFGLAESRFGRVVVGDPKLIHDLKRGRSMTMLTLNRITAFISKYRNAKSLPLDRVHWKSGTAEML